MTTIYDWSLLAAGNANADDIINWAEGQPPSSVNNSARSMMQRVREFITDLGGGIIAGGTANSVTLAGASPVSVYTGGIIIRFRAVVSNTDKTTVNLNNLGAKPVFKTTYAGVIQLTGGEIQAEGIYELVYSPKLNGGGGGWLLLSPTPPPSVAAGMVAPFAMPTPPAGWLACDGAAISRVKYAGLFDAIGTVWGKGDGSTTFNVPDFRGMFLRGVDMGRNVDADRRFASRQESENKEHVHTGITSESGSHQHHFRLRMVLPGGDGGGANFPEPGYFMDQDFNTDPAGIHNHSFKTNSVGGKENRPVNMSVLYAIKV